MALLGFSITLLGRLEALLQLRKGSIPAGFEAPTGGEVHVVEIVDLLLEPPTPRAGELDTEQGMDVGDEIPTQLGQGQIALGCPQDLGGAPVLLLGSPSPRGLTMEDGPDLIVRGSSLRDRPEPSVLLSLEPGGGAVEVLLGDPVCLTGVFELDRDSRCQGSAPGPDGLDIIAGDPVRIQQATLHGLEEGGLACAVRGVDDVEALSERADGYLLEEATPTGHCNRPENHAVSSLASR